MMPSFSMLFAPAVLALRGFHGGGQGAAIRHVGVGLDLADDLVLVNQKYRSTTIFDAVVYSRGACHRHRILDSAALWAQAEQVLR